MLGERERNKERKRETARERDAEINRLKGVENRQRERGSCDELTFKALSVRSPY